MEYQSKIKEHLQTIVGKQLDAINLACEMMMFSFEKYELHAQCLTRITCENNKIGMVKMSAIMTNGFLLSNIEQK